MKINKINQLLINKQLKEAFVQGAKWWEYAQTGATMWQYDQKRTTEEADKRLKNKTLGKDVLE